MQSVKKEAGSDLPATRELTAQASKKIYAELKKGQDTPLQQITPEQVGGAVVRIVSHLPGVDMIEDREERYLRYRFGFDDDMEHPLTETAKHFRLSESRAKKTEALALDNVWLELPWWY